MGDKTKVAVKCFVSVVLLVLVFRGTKWDESMAVLCDMRWNYVVLVLACHFAMHFLTTLRWRFLLTALGTTVRYRTLLGYHFVGLFFQIVLPASSGPDIVRGLYLARRVDKRQAFASLVMGRILGLAVIVGSALVIYILRRDMLSRSVGLSHHVLVALVVLGIALLAFPLRLDVLVFRYCPAFLRNNRLYRFLEGLHRALLLYRSQSHYLIPCIALSFLVLICMILIHYFLFLALGVATVSIGYLAFVVPLIFVAILVPISINGLGVREALYLYFFSTVVQAQEQIYAFSIANVVLLLIPSLAGGVIYLVRK